jgi:phage-related protein
MFEQARTQSVVEEMVLRNHPLYRWQEFVSGQKDGAGFFSRKDPNKIAEAIVRQMSHPEVTKILAREFENLSPEVRLRVATFCNQSNMTGNVRKEVQRLDHLVGGKLLREGGGITVNKRVEGREGVYYVQKRVNPAVAGAMQKYAGYQKPDKKSK